jgi:hypothetical protein
MKSESSLMRMANKYGGNLTTNNVMKRLALSYFPKCHIANMAVGFAVLVFFIFTTVMPVETRWSAAEVVAAKALPFVCIAGFAFALLQNTENKKISLLDVLVIAWYAYFLCRAWVGNEFPCATQFLKETELFALYFSLRAIFCSINIPPVFIIVLLVISGCYEAVLGLWQTVPGESRHTLYLFTGSFLNPGPYSAYLLIALVAGLLAKDEIISLSRKYSQSGSRYITAFYFVLLAIPAIMLPATWSRAAIIAFILVCLLAYRKNYWRKRYVIWGLCIATILILYFIKQNSADGRMLTWIACCKTWSYVPWLGVGIGGFKNACAKGIAELYATDPANRLFASGNVADYAFCDILKILVEQGIVGVIFCLIVTAMTLHNVYSYSRSLFYSLLSLLLFSLFSYPFELYPFRAIAVIIAVLSSQVAYNEDGKRIGPLFLFLIGITIMAGYMAKEINLRSKIDKEADLFLCGQPYLMEDFQKILSKENDNPRILFIFAKSLRSNGRYNDSNVFLRQGALASNDPMFLLLQAGNYKDMACHNLAEQAYLKSYAMMPNRLYPLYRLMLLYESTGQKAKAKRMAKKILEAKPKVDSQATEDIKNKARAIL